MLIKILPFKDIFKDITTVIDILLAFNNVIIYIIFLYIILILIF